jgi:hypothetical protein
MKQSHERKVVELEMKEMRQEEGLVDIDLSEPKGVTHEAPQVNVELEIPEGNMESNTTSVHHEDSHYIGELPRASRLKTLKKLASFSLPTLLVGFGLGRLSNRTSTASQENIELMDQDPFALCKAGKFIKENLFPEATSYKKEDFDWVQKEIDAYGHQHPSIPLDESAVDLMKHYSNNMEYGKVHDIFTYKTIFDPSTTEDFFDRINQQDNRFFDLIGYKPKGVDSPEYSSFIIQANNEEKYGKDHSYDDVILKSAGKYTLAIAPDYRRQRCDIHVYDMSDAKKPDLLFIDSIQNPADDNKILLPKPPKISLSESGDLFMVFPVGDRSATELQLYKVDFDTKKLEMLEYGERYYSLDADAIESDKDFTVAGNSTLVFPRYYQEAWLKNNVYIVAFDSETNFMGGSKVGVDRVAENESNVAQFNINNIDHMSLTLKDGEKSNLILIGQNQMNARDTSIYAIPVNFLELECGKGNNNCFKVYEEPINISELMHVESKHTLLDSSIADQKVSVVYKKDSGLPEYYLDVIDLENKELKNRVSLNQDGQDLGKLDVSFSNESILIKTNGPYYFEFNTQTNTLTKGHLLNEDCSPARVVSVNPNIREDRAVKIAEKTQSQIIGLNTNQGIFKITTKSEEKMRLKKDGDLS